MLVFLSNLFYDQLVDYSILLKARHHELIHESITLHNHDLIWIAWRQPKCFARMENPIYRIAINKVIRIYIWDWTCLSFHLGKLETFRSFQVTYLFQGELFKWKYFAWNVIRFLPNSVYICHHIPIKNRLSCCYL